MIDITCEICMDLMPLVEDGVASNDSVIAVKNHIENCPQCREIFNGEIPKSSNSHEIVSKLQKKIQLSSVMVLMFGVFWGLSLTASNGMFYNILIMPIIGGIGYYIFHWKSLYNIPLLLLITHIIINLFDMIKGAEYLHLFDLITWCLTYCVFAIIGILIAGLLHYAFRKES